MEEAVALADRRQPRAEMEPEDPLLILYISGATGRPKGVVHVHGGYTVGIYATTRLVSTSSRRTSTDARPTRGG